MYGVSAGGGWVFRLGVSGGCLVFRVKFWLGVGRGLLPSWMETQRIRRGGGVIYDIIIEPTSSVSQALVSISKKSDWSSMTVVRLAEFLGAGGGGGIGVCQSCAYVCDVCVFGCR